MRSFAAILAFTLIGVSPCAKAQQSPLDPVAADAAAAIVKASPKHGSGTNVLVADFSKAKGRPTALGSDLAGQFFLSLQSHARNFALADRDKYLREFAADELTPGSYEGDVSLRCYASELHATVVVTGELDDLDDKVVVWIKVIRFEDKEMIFDRRVSLPRTPAMEELLKLAPDAATTIQYRYKYLDSRPRVLVEDFLDDRRSESDLGLRLADEFQRDLKAREKDFFVMDRAERHEPSAQELDDLQSRCPSPKDEPGPEIVIQGYYQVYPGNDVALRIEVLLDRGILAKHETRLTFSPELLHRFLPPEPEPEPDRLRGKILWVRAHSGKDKTEKAVRLPRAGEKGYTMPACLYCPNPTFSAEAVHAKASGTVIFDVEVDAEGEIAAIAVVKPLPCALTEKALDAVEGWRLKPALGPDGKPAAVRAPIEVTFN